jgi:hypothetical protein
LSITADEFVFRWTFVSLGTDVFELCLFAGTGAVAPTLTEILASLRAV